MPDASQDEKPPHPAVEGPESPLEDVREQAHEEPGLTAKLEAANERVKELEARLERAEKDVGEKFAAREKELTERLARLQADFENFRRRAREDSAQAASRGRADFVKAILPALDNLDRALAHSKEEGLQLLAKHLHATLAGQGLVVLDPTGEAFDAKVHEAIAQESREGAKAGTVLTVVEKGYALDGRVLRPARVIVAS